MNLKQAVAQANLAVPEKGPEQKSSEQVTFRVFQIAAQTGQPIQDLTRKQWRKKWLASNRFMLVRVKASAIASPFRPSVVLASAVKVSAEPLVVDLNMRAAGRTGSGYVPEVIVVDGGDRHRRHIQAGNGIVWAWVGEKALKKMGHVIRADHDMGSNELRTKIDELLREKFKKNDAKSSPCMSSGAWVAEIYPFENYFVYSYEGKTYKQAYTVGEKRAVSFTSQPVEVVTQFVPIGKATKVDAAMLSVPRQDMPQNGSANHMPMPGVKGGKLYSAVSNPRGPRGLSIDPSVSQPGSGIGPRTEPSRGASKSETKQKATFHPDGKISKGGSRSEAQQMKFGKKSKK
jgi:hypothetical protein